MADIGTDERELYAFLDTRHPEILTTLAGKAPLDDRIAVSLDAALQEFSSGRIAAGFAAAA